MGMRSGARAGSFGSFSPGRKKEIIQGSHLCFTQHVLICWVWVSTGVSTKGFWKSTSMGTKISLVLEELIGSY